MILSSKSIFSSFFILTLLSSLCLIFSCVKEKRKEMVLVDTCNEVPIVHKGKRNGELLRLINKYNLHPKKNENDMEACRYSFYAAKLDGYYYILIVAHYKPDNIVLDGDMMLKINERGQIYSVRTGGAILPGMMEYVVDPRHNVYNEEGFLYDRDYLKRIISEGISCRVVYK